MTLDKIVAERNLTYIKKGHLIYNASDPILVARISEFETIEFNYYDNVKQPREDIAVADCGCIKQNSRRRGYLCGDSLCRNRYTQTECDPETCPMGIDCRNQRLQRKEYSPYELFVIEGKGIGARALLPIQRGALIAEYIGEVIDKAEYVKRMASSKDQREGHYYMSEFVGSLYIDASKKGNSSRFLNHSCSPNCRFEKRAVGGTTRTGLFAEKDIAEGEELTFDYMSGSSGDLHFKCGCKSLNCIENTMETQDLVDVEDQFSDAMNMGGEENKEPQQSNPLKSIQSSVQNPPRRQLAIKRGFKILNKRSSNEGQENKESGTKAEAGTPPSIAIPRVVEFIDLTQTNETLPVIDLTLSDDE